MAHTPEHMIIGRFAPSPTGRMHAGNIYAALMSWLIVKSQGGRMVLRIEDLDAQRSKPEFIDQVQRDFEALGLFWDEGPYFQHDRDGAYEEAYQSLADMGLVYSCFCTRADLHAASAPHVGEKPIYAGTCRDLSHVERQRRSESRQPAWRLRVSADNYAVDDAIQGTFAQKLDTECGDFLIRRADGSFAYQLAVVVDDAAQGVNCVVRGVDLLDSSPQQRYLQDLLGLPHVEYAHVPLLVAPDGRRLSKRNKDAAFEELLQVYKTPEGIIGHIACLAGMISEDVPCTPEELLASFDIENLKRFKASAITWG